MPDRNLAEELRACLDAHVFEQVTMAAAADQIGSGSTQLARAFADAFGIAPHVYVIGRRLDAARDRIPGGQALADVGCRRWLLRPGSPVPPVQEVPGDDTRPLRTRGMT